MGRWYEDPVGAAIIRKKYLHDGEQTFADMVERIAACFSDGIRDQVKGALLRADFFPGGRSLYALGCKGKFKATTSNCYILPSPADDLSSIFDVGKQMAIIFSQGGGCGINLSGLRPRGAKVRNAAKTSSGAVSFMEFYNNVASLISQKNRRGALLIGLNCNHPDVEEFLEAKRNNERLQSANISILFSDEFMRLANRPDSSYELSFNVVSTGERIQRTINAREFFEKFAEANRDYAEPGAIFIDRVRGWNLLSADSGYRIEIANPCGEFFGNAFSACNLGSINLYSLIREPFTQQAALDMALLRERVTLAVEALNEILDYGSELQPLAENRQNITDYRPIGLGVFGLGDALVAVGIRYGSPESIAFCAELFREIFLQALRTSNGLAAKHGAYAKCEPARLLSAPVLQFVATEDSFLWRDIGRYGLRNASLLSIAPTGTISTMCGMSGGIEPLFEISYHRTTHSLVTEGRYFLVYSRGVQDLLAHYGMAPTTPVPEVQQKFPFVVAAHDIDPVDRVKLQGTIQRYVDNAISSTVNLPVRATSREVGTVFQTAWESGCKGVTVFVAGCRRSAILIP